MCTSYFFFIGEHFETIALFLMLQFNMEYVQFCTELAIKALKKDRFVMTTKVNEGDGDIDKKADLACVGIIESCRAVARLYREHLQMSAVSPSASPPAISSSTMSVSPAC